VLQVHVARLVEEGEPELVFGLAAQGHRVVPFQGTFFISGTNTTATPASAHRRTISGRKRPPYIPVAT
jgi:hypothetical protein